MRLAMVGWGWDPPRLGGARHLLARWLLLVVIAELV